MLNNLLFLLIDFALVGGLILLVGCVAMRFFKQPIERLRIIEWTLAGCLVAPLLQQIPGVPRWSLGLWPQREVAAADERSPIQATPAPEFVAAMGDEYPMPPTISRTESLTPTDPASSIPHPASTDTPFRPQWSWPLAILLAFVAGSLCMIVWLLVGMTSLWRIARRSQPAPERVRELFGRIAGEHHERIRLATTGRLELPIAFGLVRPTILLPQKTVPNRHRSRTARSASPTNSPTSATATCWAWRFCSLLGLAFFYQPLYWQLRRQLRLAQDYLADHHAAQTAEATDYASFLVSLAHRRLGIDTAVGLSIGDGKSNLFRRVTTLLNDRAMLLHIRRRRNLGLAALAITLIAVISTVRFGFAEADEEHTSKIDQYDDPLPDGAILRMGAVAAYQFVERRRLFARRKNDRLLRLGSSRPTLGCRDRQANSSTRRHDRLWKFCRCIFARWQ